jgi:periplasmic divalent cation tolerance protein
MADVFLVFSAYPDAGQARDAARVLVEERLAACVTVLPGATSVYRWDGEVAEVSEAVCIAKTVADSVEALVARWRELHPYDVPEIIAVPVAAGLSAYVDWIAGSCGR